jgi:protein TonB
VSGFNKNSRQDDWPHHRNPYLRVALIVVAVHLIVFVFAPPFHFKPYRLEAQEIMVVQDIPDFEPLPPVAKEPPMPKRIDQGLDEGEEDPILPRGPIDHDHWPPPAPEKHPGTPGFQHFDKLPVPKLLVQPEYPDLARQAGIEGVVRVKVTIDIEGKVIAASVFDSDVTEAMNRAALVAARRCEFEPAKQGSKPVPVVIIIPFEFSLE